jgi:hypothetical protein
VNSKSNQFKPGDVVNIAIEGARVDGVVKNGIHVVMPNGATASVELSNYEGITIEHAAPVEWPPRPGDLWQEVDGALWFAQSLGGSQMALVPANVRGSLDTALPAYVLENFGPLTLAHREDPR